MSGRNDGNTNKDKPNPQKPKSNAKGNPKQTDRKGGRG